MCLKLLCRFDINIGNGTYHSETITTELNERILKHYKTFCSNYKVDKKEDPSSSIEVNEGKNEGVYSL